MSVEKLARRALRRAAFWRAVVALLDCPGNVLNAFAGLVHRLADLFGELSSAALYFEVDAARTYKTLTGVDLGFAASGDIERYAGANPEALARAESDDFDGETYDDD